MSTIKYSTLAIFKKEPNTADKDPYWADFKKAQTETYKCRDCDKVLISRQKIDLDFFWVGELKDNQHHLCSDSYLKRLEANDQIIINDFHKWHYFYKSHE